MRQYNPRKRILVIGGASFLGSHLIFGNWQPEVQLEVGLVNTIAYFDRLLTDEAH